MEKAITFTEEQKSLIWRTKVQPKNGTADDAFLFMEVCEQYGLNPLLGDIVFNRYETNNGPVVNFIVSRDGYLKAAMRDKDFVKCPSAVIKEGDEFQMDMDGNVIHKFGKSRGKILGAWAYAEHAKRGKLPVTVDFAEYFKANAKSQNGRSPVWDAMPSAMIQKVAEVAALRRQFPLGGIVTEEELGLDDVINKDKDYSSLTQVTQSPQVETPTEEKSSTKKQEKSKSNNTKNKKEKEKEKNVEVNKQELPKVEEIAESQPEIEAVESTLKTEPQQELQKEETTNKPVSKETTVNENSPQEEIQFKPFKILAFQDGETPGGKKFLKVAVENEIGNKMILIARGDVIKQLDEVEKEQKCLFHIENVNGYDTLVHFGGLAG